MATHRSNSSNGSDNQQLTPNQQRLSTMLDSLQQHTTAIVDEAMMDRMFADQLSLLALISLDGEGREFVAFARFHQPGNQPVWMQEESHE